MFDSHDAEVGHVCQVLSILHLLLVSLSLSLTSRVSIFLSHFVWANQMKPFFISRSSVTQKHFHNFLHLRVFTTFHSNNKVGICSLSVAYSSRRETFGVANPTSEEAKEISCQRLNLIVPQRHVDVSFLQPFRKLTTMKQSARYVFAFKWLSYCIQICPIIFDWKDDKHVNWLKATLVIVNTSR